MTVFVNMRYGVPAAAALLPVLAAVPAGALSSVHPAAVSNVTTPAIIKVHDRWNDDGDYSWRHHRSHHQHRRDIVDAPFTRVETGRRVIVDAPFAHVAVNRRGRHVVAPFVDLWLPR